MAWHIWEAMPEKPKNVLLSGKFRSKVFRLDVGDPPRTLQQPDWENYVWLAPITKFWPCINS
eukprot:9562394-Alexandrium_andersonii.AAC.1